MFYFFFSLILSAKNTGNKFEDFAKKPTGQFAKIVDGKIVKHDPSKKGCDLKKEPYYNSKPTKSNR